MGAPLKVHTLMAKVKSSTVNGIATCVLDIPAGGRMIKGGCGWFENFNQDDCLEIYIVDSNDNIISGYVDTEVSSDNRGQYIPSSGLKLEPVSEVGSIPGGYKLKLIATKGDSSVDTFRANIHWGILL